MASPLALLPAGVDPVKAEGRVKRLWLRGCAADAIALKTGLPVQYVKDTVARVRKYLRDAGADWKAERAERLLALNDHLRAKLVARIDRAGNDFALTDVRELRELMALEMKQLGLAAPERFQYVEPARSYDELVEQCKMYGIPVPTDEYGPDPAPLPLALPPTDGASG